MARSRADAPAWCVRLVGRNTDTWLAELRESLDKVQQVRSKGPDVAESPDPTDSRKSESE